MIAVEAKADHTGYVALAVFDDEFNEPLEIYGGPKDAAFTWQVTAEGQIILTDPTTGTSISSLRTRGDDSNGSFVDIGKINMSCSSGNISFSNASHQGSLTRASDNNSGLIQDWMAKSTLPRACITDSIPVLLFPDYMNYVFNYPSVAPSAIPAHSAAPSLSTSRTISLSRAFCSTTTSTVWVTTSTTI